MIYYIVACNGCGAHVDAPPSASLDAARRNARTLGWTHPKRGMDCCPTCSTARAAREKKENPNGYF